MKITKLILPILVFSILLLSNPTSTWASDLTVTCNGTSCTNSGNSLFNQTNIYPGYTVTKTIKIDNLANIDSCNLNLSLTRIGSKQTPDLAEKIVTLIKEGTNVYYGDESNLNPKRLSDLLTTTIPLGVVGANSIKEYSWKADFESDSGNIYQNTSVKLDFSINFTCGTLPNPVTPTGSVNGVSTKRSSSSNSSDSSVLGTVTDETIVLSSSSSESSGTTSSKESKDEGKVLGESCEKVTNYWWIPLLLQLILSVIVLIFKYSRINMKWIWGILIILAVLSQIIHMIFGCDCISSYWCPNYLLLNILLVILGIFNYFVLLKLKQKSYK